jgi:hypothetical protein
MLIAPRGFNQLNEDYLTQMALQEYLLDVKGTVCSIELEKFQAYEAPKDSLQDLNREH